MRLNLDTIIDDLKVALKQEESAVTRSNSDVNKCQVVFIGQIYKNSPDQSSKPAVLDEDNFYGCVVQQSVACGRLGAEVGVIGVIGKDDNGKAQLKQMISDGIDVEGVVQIPIKTDEVKLAWDANGKITVFKLTKTKNKSDLTPAQVRTSKSKLQRCKMVVATVFGKDEGVVEALKIAKESDIEEGEGTEGGRQDVITMVYVAKSPEAGLNQSIWDPTDILCCEICEAKDIIKKSSKADANEPEEPDADKQGPSSTNADAQEDDVEEIVASLLSLGVKVAIVLSETGLAMAYGIAAGMQIKRVDSPKDLKVVDASGATDAFVGSLAYFTVCHNGLSWDEKISRSCAIAGGTMSRSGGVPSYKKKADLPPELFQ